MLQCKTLKVNLCNKQKKKNRSSNQRFIETEKSSFTLILFSSVLVEYRENVESFKAP